MNITLTGTLFAVVCLMTQPAVAIERGTLPLESKSRIATTKSSYDCGSLARLDVIYVNAEPNFFAIVPIPTQQQPIVFASVIAGSGARYAAGKYIWWSKGNSASLYDVTLGDNAAPLLTCTAIN